MLLAITPNPTIDRSLWLGKLEPGQVHRTSRVHLAAGGKGMNVARAALCLGVPTTVTGPLAGHTGKLLRALAIEEGFQADWRRRQKGETRQCHLIHVEGGDSTVINESGDPMDPADWLRFRNHARNLARHASAVTISGSLPPGLPAESLTTLAERLAQAGRPVYVDGSGPSLAHALQHPQGLSLKINHREFTSALGLRDLEELKSLLTPVKEMAAAGARLIVVTAGDRGALAVTGEESWLLEPPQVKLHSSVGSGDSFLAGLVVGQLKGMNLEASLKLACGCGAANAESELPGRFDPESARMLAGETKARFLSQ